MFDTLASSVNKRDTLYLLGDVAFTPEWILKLEEIKCVKKVLILGNHDTEQKRAKHLPLFAQVFDEIHGLYKKKPILVIPCPDPSSRVEREV